MNRISLILSFLIVLLIQKISLGQCDLDSIGEPPTLQEIDNVLIEWESRDQTVYNWQIVKDTIIQNNRIVVASHEIDSFIHYGLIRLPSDSNLVTCPLPALLYLHGGTNGVGINKINILDVYFPNSLLHDSLILIVPSYRSEHLFLDSNTVYYSQGQSTELDKDADDAIIFMNGVIDNFPQVDTTRITAIGLSRGGNVAFRVGIRSSLIKALNILFTTTNYFDSILIEDAKNAVLNSVSPQFIINNIVANDVIKPYCLGTISFQEAREKIVSYSPGYFTNLLPPTNFFHGSLDSVIPIGQPQFMDSMMNITNPGSNEFQYFEYPNGSHSMSSLVGFETHALSLIQEVIQPALIFNVDSLYSKGNSPAYQWYLNGSIIPNETSLSIYPIQSGIYQLEHILSGGCSYFSESYNWVITDIETNKLHHDRLFFDPVNKVIGLRASYENKAEHFEIVDMYGQIVFQKKDNVNFPFSYSSLGLFPGLYIFRVSLAKGKESIKFIVL